jgi:hypothetical protein
MSLPPTCVEATTATVPIPLVSAVRSHAHFVTLSVRKHAKRRTWNLLSRLNDRAPEHLGLFEGGRHILDRHEEKNLVLGTLAWADGDIGAALDTSVNKGITRKRAFGCDLPIEEICVEFPCGVWFAGTDLSVNHGVGHFEASIRRERSMALVEQHDEAEVTRSTEMRKIWDRHRMFIECRFDAGRAASWLPWPA